MEYTADGWDSLYSIAQRYGISVEELAEYNGISEDEPLQYGQKLKIPQRKKNYLTMDNEEFKARQEETHGNPRAISITGDFEYADGGNKTRVLPSTSSGAIPPYTYYNPKDQPISDPDLDQLSYEIISGNIMGLGEQLAFRNTPLNMGLSFDDEHDLGGPAQRTYLMPNGRKGQEVVFRRYGYFPVEVDLNSDKPYGLVTEATLALNNRRGDVIPIYQRNEDAVPRNKLKPIANADFNQDIGLIFGGTEPYNIANHSAAIYVDPETNLLYYNTWDLNDYGGENGYISRFPKPVRMLADGLDLIGLPVVVSTGVQPLTFGLDTQLSLEDFVDDTYYDGRLYSSKESKPLIEKIVGHYNVFGEN